MTGPDRALFAVNQFRIKFVPAAAKKSNRRTLRPGDAHPLVNVRSGGVGGLRLRVRFERSLVPLQRHHIAGDAGEILACGLERAV